MVTATYDMLQFESMTFSSLHTPSAILTSIRKLKTATPLSLLSCERIYDAPVHINRPQNSSEQVNLAFLTLLCIIMLKMPFIMLVHVHGGRGK